MKLTSKFKDYYDGACAWDREPVPFYLRNTQEIKLLEPGVSASPEARASDTAAYRAARPAYALLGRMPAPSSSYAYRIRSVVIAFCGRLYPLYFFESEAYYDFQSLLDAVNLKSKELYGWDYKKLAQEMVKGSSRLLYRPPHRPAFTLSGWENFLKNHPERTISDDSFRHFRSPVFAVGVETRVIVVNPQLKHYNFASQVDPYTAYQELDMFLGNNLSGQMDPPDLVSDELKAHYHGHNGPYSFKTPPGTKKRKGKSK